MKKIYKYTLDTTNMQEIQMPIGAKILALQVQNNIPCIWAEVNTHHINERRMFLTFGTGHELHGYNPVYVGTYQLDGGSLVFHVYETEI